MPDGHDSTAASFLIVEDDILVARFVEDVLHSLGHLRTRLAHDAASVFASTEPHDIAFVDIHLGEGLDGIDVASRLRSKHGLRIIFITAYDDNHTLDRALALGPVAYLLKPFDERDLRVVIRLALENRKKGADPARKTNLSAIDTATLRRRIDKELIDNQLFLDPDLNFGALAQDLGITTHQLSEMFNRVMGVGFRDYLRQLRIQEACRRLVAEPETSVLRVGFDVGFNSRSTFHDAFRKVMGVTPEEYRRRPPM